MAKENQKEIWNNIAIKWAEYRKSTLPEVKTFLKDKKGKIIDIGCGSGRNFEYIKEEIYGIDFSEKMTELAKAKLDEMNVAGEVICANADKLPFEDSFFDYAICIAAIHCIDSENKREKAIKEIYRILKPKAKALITVWSKNHGRIKKNAKEQYIPWTVDGKKHMRYYYIYDKNEIERLLKKAGFKIVNSIENENIVIEAEK